MKCTECVVEGLSREGGGGRRRPDDRRGRPQAVSRPVDTLSESLRGAGPLRRAAPQQSPVVVRRCRFQLPLPTHRLDPGQRQLFPSDRFATRSSPAAPYKQVSSQEVLQMHSYRLIYRTRSRVGSWCMTDFFRGLHGVGKTAETSYRWLGELCHWYAGIIFNGSGRSLMRATLFGIKTLNRACGL